MNAPAPLATIHLLSLASYAKRLVSEGVSKITVEDLTVCEFLKDLDLPVHLAISLTAGVRSVQHLAAAELAGADSVYLDALRVNRDFPLLRALIRVSRVPLHLYANVSCLSACPAKLAHYELFAENWTNESDRKNQAFYAFCSSVKLRNPVEWLQMPWIRPEDIVAYRDEGICQFKLADRMSSTAVLLDIARCYIYKRSPENLFSLMERDGMKFRSSLGAQSETHCLPSPLYIASSALPDNFIEHFRSGACRSRKPSCPTCRAISSQCIQADSDWLSLANMVNGSRRMALERFACRRCALETKLPST
jgi:hypothetical protein